MNNEVNNENKTVIIKEKKGFFSKLIEVFGMKVIFIALIVIILIIVGGSFITTNIFFQTKTTKLGLKDVGKLVTQTCYTTVVQDSKKDKEFFKDFKIPFSESRQIYSYDFEVNAFVDFELIKIKNDKNNKTLRILLPHAKIDQVNKNNDSLKVYLDEGSIFSRIGLVTSNEAEKKMKNQAIIDCTANKTLESADKNAKILIQSLLAGSGEYKDYTYVFEYID